MKVSIEPKASKYVKARGGKVYLFQKKYCWSGAWGATTKSSYLPVVSTRKPDTVVEFIPLEIDSIDVFYDPNIPNQELTITLEIINLKHVLALKENWGLIKR